MTLSMLFEPIWLPLYSLPAMVMLGMKPCADTQARAERRNAMLVIGVIIVNVCCATVFRTAKESLVNEGRGRGRRRGREGEGGGQEAEEALYAVCCIYIAGHGGH